MRYDADQKRRTRERVLQEAAKAIRAEGPHKLGVADVMARAGLTHGGFYAHFGSKEELIAEAIGQTFASSRGRFARETEGRSPRDGLIAYIDFYLSPMHRDGRDSGCPIPALGADLPRLTDDAREKFSTGVAGLTAALTGKLAELGRPAPEDEAPSVLAELVGALTLARAEPDPARSDAILAASRNQLKRRLGLEPLS